ncbi:unnamed protein product [Paramecium primaurelia]|uniref:Uncharacterized protein n=1 Tax=Paramecium primaurelia TaxID=5886 RepID=A0A8S1PGP7_PARPR|nr:unnamed protein product [Paramecium primaurelia]
MKTILYTILLFKLVHSQCHLRSIQSCLQDEQCQLVKHECQSRPNKCEDIDASNPNNCSGIQCYYDFELKICQPYEDEYDIKSRRILDHNDGRNYEESESQHNDKNQYNQNGEYPNQHQNNETTNSNSDEPIPPENESNSSVIQNNTGQDNQSTNSTSLNTTDVIAFEMVQFNFNQEKILNSNLDEKDLVINTSFSIALTATVILAKLFI